MSDEPAPPRRFTLEEARALLPEVRRITGEAAEAFDAQQAEAARARSTEEVVEVQQALRRIATEWVARIQALGAECKGLWLVDFDNGAGYYCWRHPETDLEYFHGYEEGFGGRLRIN